MAMMFRDHNDPLYYDAKANDKIFVPVKDLVSITRSTLTNFMFQASMSEAQRKIVESFPKADRGEFDEGEAVHEEDFLVAGHKKYLNKQIEMRAKKNAREGIDGGSDDSNSDLENGDILDSEEEEYQEKIMRGEDNPAMVFKASHKLEKEFKIKFNKPAPQGIAVVKAGDEVEEEKPEEKEPTLQEMFDDDDDAEVSPDEEDAAYL